jgi:hypothetical protein
MGLCLGMEKKDYIWLILEWKFWIVLKSSHYEFRAILDKDPRTNLKQIEPWIGPFFTFFKK